MTPHIIVDLDNCIANDSWRIPKINWQKANPMDRYHDYHSLSAWDELGNTDIFEAHPGARIIVFTARPVLYAAITQEWLKRRGVNYDHLVMRNNNDHRPSIDLKRTMLSWLPQIYGVGLDEIVAAYDDRQDVVDMYRSHGITAHRREIHNVCAYTAPHKEPA